MSSSQVHDRLFTSALAATLALAVVIAYLTLAPIHDPGVPGSDKSHHFIAFAALAFPLSFARPRVTPWVILLAAAYGGAIELIQPFVGRDKEFLDFVSDAIGAALGGALGVAFHWLRQRLRRSATG